MKQMCTKMGTTRPIVNLGHRPSQNITGIHVLMFIQIQADPRCLVLVRIPCVPSQPRAIHKKKVSHEPSQKVLSPFQIIRYSKNLESQKHLKFDQNYRENYKKL
jgi:hypothetical protein